MCHDVTYPNIDRQFAVVRVLERGEGGALERFSIFSIEKKSATEKIEGLMVERSQSVAFAPF